MDLTLRQTLARMLSHGRHSALDLARALLLTPREVEEHLAHLARGQRGRLRVEPARCRQCGHVFRDRRRLDAPGRCPRCRQEMVEGPWFSLPGDTAKRK